MNNKVYIGVIVVMLGVIGYLAYKMNSLEKEKVYIYKEYENLDVERQELAMELEELNLSYDTLSTDNEAMKLEIAGQKEEIEKLLVKVKNGNYEVNKLKKEAETLRTIMKGYIHQIDSLNQANDKLTVERDAERMRADEASATVKQQEADIKVLDEAVKTSQILQASAFTNTGVQLRSNGRQDDTDRASRSEMIKSCFTVRKNLNAKNGTRNIYLSITGPDGQLLLNKDGGVTVKINGADQPMSVSREIDYQREDLDVCVYYSAQKELAKGNYKISVYEGGHMIGQSDLVLR